MFPSKPSFQRSFRLPSPPPPLPTKVPCKFCCVTTPLYTQPPLLIRLLRALYIYIYTHAYIHIYTHIYLLESLSKTSCRSTVQFVQVPETFVPTCVASIGEVEGEKKERCSRVCPQTIAPEREFPSSHPPSFLRMDILYGSLFGGRVF